MNDPEAEPHDDDLTGHAAKIGALLGVVFALVALGVYGSRAAFSVLVGATLGMANLLTMRAIVRALVKAPPPERGEGNATDELPEATPKPGQAGSIAWALFAGFKILILFGGVWILLTQRLVDPMPLTVGYGVLPLGIAGSALWSSVTSRS